MFLSVVIFRARLLPAASIAPSILVSRLHIGRSKSSVHFFPVMTFPSRNALFTVFASFETVGRVLLCLRITVTESQSVVDIFLGVGGLVWWCGGAVWCGGEVWGGVGFGGENEREGAGRKKKGGGEKEVEGDVRNNKTERDGRRGGGMREGIGENGRS